RFHRRDRRETAFAGPCHPEKRGGNADTARTPLPLPRVRDVHSLATAYSSEPDQLPSLESPQREMLVTCPTPNNKFADIPILRHAPRFRHPILAPKLKGSRSGHYDFRALAFTRVLN